MSSAANSPFRVSFFGVKFFFGEEYARRFNFLESLPALSPKLALFRSEINAKDLFIISFLLHFQSTLDSNASSFSLSNLVP